MVTLIRAGVLWRLIRVYTDCECPQNTFGQNYFNLKGRQVCFAWCKFEKANPAHYRWTVMRHSVSSDQGLHCLKSQKTMPLDRSIGQIHLKVQGFQVCFICCKFTKVPVLWQTVLTLNKRRVLRLSDLHCWDGLPWTVHLLLDSSFRGHDWFCWRKAPKNSTPCVASHWNAWMSRYSSGVPHKKKPRDLMVAGNCFMRKTIL